MVLQTFLEDSRIKKLKRYFYKRVLINGTFDQTHYATVSRRLSCVLVHSVSSSQCCI